MLRILVSVAVSVFAVSQALVGKPCTQVSECDAGECCQILSQFMVVSKRQSGSLFQNPTNGTCQKYRVEGDNCSTFEKMNGYCGCEPGTTCHMYEVPLPTTLVTSRDMAIARPGYQWVSRCEKHST
ncbi:U3-aranetoxin-Ce1a [Biomphalaria glabrata]|uniref:Prokineticin domain-containing protein n=1 Tax=Biomphalaria glabrata TaxID=6526 RepID=A0A2C9M1F2_BIOGL|nr:U3-aranetoxin-Ce1a [Biomphalaria glabrata]